jgi:hypothetical protein
LEGPSGTCRSAGWRFGCWRRSWPRARRCPHSSRARAQESDPLAGPKAHFKVDNPAALTDSEAQDIYERIRNDLVRGYGLSGESAAAYVRWRRYNTSPYRSSTHGERFVNNYANGLARAYGRFEDAGVLPQGSVLAKDSFAVTKEGQVFSGPLFVMEKMAPGFNAASRDWRYTMIMPDGSLFGTTGGEGGGKVKFCITCHETAGGQGDQLFLVPKAYRQ